MDAGAARAQLDAIVQNVDLPGACAEADGTFSQTLAGHGPGIGMR